MKTISFIIPTIGKSDKLENLIRTIRNFDRDVQIIIIDNSKEGNHCLKYDNLRIDYFHLPEGGVSKARNFGASKANTDFIYFLDDDVIPNTKWSNALKDVLSNPKYENSITGGSVFIGENIKKMIPTKYSFLVGEKILGGEDRLLGNNYLAGCNIIIDKKIFLNLRGFPEEYGHRDGKIVLNEEIYLQKKAKKNGINVYYKKNLSVIHHWRGDKEKLINRAAIQGLYDRKLDLQLNKSQFILRISKHIVTIPVKLILVYLFKQKYTAHHFDLMKYSSYVGYRNQDN